ncbi:type II secretion system secretin GspD [Zoogloea sp.]|uniref:type II secretion system secretin GspD n=1 Tax=Zoogloea sp. TaxID=49181 RepID=UPI0035B48FDE
MKPVRRSQGLARQLSAACLAVTLAFGQLPAFAVGGPATDTVSLNFVNADIGAVIQAISKISGHNFVVDPRVKGTLNIVTSTPVARNLTYSILLSALRLQGYTAVEGQGVTKIVPEADAKLHAVPVGKGGSTNGDRMITRVFSLKYESANQLVPVIRPLVSPNNTVSAYPGNNSLVVTDYAENLARVAQIIESIDVPQGDARVIPVQHASATDLAQTITKLLNDGAANIAAAAGGGGDNSQKVTVIGDPRTNNLLVRSENPAKLNIVRQLVGSLDQPGAAGNIHVVYLRNAEATKVAQTLRAVLSGEAGSSGSGGTGSSNSTSNNSSSFSGTGSSTGNSNSSTSGSSSGSSSNASGFGNTPSFNNNNNANAGALGNGIIQADPYTNALIITAPDAIYNNVRRVIDQLDRRRAQVYVEALIAEISTDKASEIGIQWQVGKYGTTSVYGGTSFGSSGNNILTLAAGLASSSSAVTPGNGLNLVLGGGTITVGGRTIANLNTLAHFLESDTKTNILSTPNLVTLDNEEAKIVVGQNVPFVTGSYATTSSNTTTNPFTTVERRDVGLTLKLKPQISEGGAVRLQIYQEASAVIASTASNTNGPSTTKRSIESTVLVDDGSMIALGGLVEDSYSGSNEKVPILGDLPWIGWMFRYGSRERAKTNLVVFLRPVVLRDAASYQGLSADRYNYIIGQQQNASPPNDRMRGEPGGPELPPPGSKPPAVPANPVSLTPGSDIPPPVATPAKP